MEIPQPTTSRKRSGLSMLIGAPVSVPVDHAAAQAATDDLLRLRVSDVHRNEQQPRVQFDPDAIATLAASIEAHGVIQPIAVRVRDAGGYEIVAGERRWLAAQRAGLERVPCVVHDVDERQTLVLALVENLVRENLSPLETARAYAALQDEFDMSTAQVARAVSRSRPAVANTLRLLELPESILVMLEQRTLTEGHGRALLGCSDRLRMQHLARLTVDRSLTVRQLEAMVREQETAVQDGRDARSASKRKWTRQPDAELADRVDALAGSWLGVRARIKLADKGAKLEFSCADVHDLVTLIEQLEAARAQAATS